MASRDITQHVRILPTPHDKLDAIAEYLKGHLELASGRVKRRITNHRIMVFVDTKRAADWLADVLSREHGVR